MMTWLVCFLACVLVRVLRWRGYSPVAAEAYVLAVLDRALKESGDAR